MSGKVSADSLLIVSRTAARSAVRSALRLYVGKGRRFSVKLLSNRSGVPDRLIEAAMCEPDDPESRALSIEALMSLAKCIGPGFLTQCLEPAGLGAFAMPAPEDIPLAVLVADAADSTADLAAVTADDRICDRDQAELAQVGHRDIARGVHLLGRATGRVRGRISKVFTAGLGRPHARSQAA